MTSPVRVSIVATAYNAEQCVESFVRSVLGQSCRDFELILVDDGSTDLTAAKIRQFSDGRIRLIPQADNRGPGHCRNVGTAAAVGDYIALADVDDWWEPERLQRLLDGAAAATTLCGTGGWFVADRLTRFFGDAGRRIRYLPYPLVAAGGGPHREIPMSEFISKELGVLKILFPRGAATALGLSHRVDVRHCEDFDFRIQMFAAGWRMFLLKEPLYNYVISGTSLTARAADKHAAEQRVMGEWVPRLQARFPEATVALRRSRDRLTLAAEIKLALRERRFSSLLSLAGRAAWHALWLMRSALGLATRTAFCRIHGVSLR